MDQTRTKIGLLCLSVMLIIALSCSRENLLTLPAPAPDIAGTYAGTARYFPLPIQGDSVRITLTSITNDSVMVAMQASTKGKRGPVVQYGKRPVVQDFSVGACVSYVVPLNPGQDSTILYMTCSAYKVLQYAKSQRPYFSGGAAKFYKL